MYSVQTKPMPPPTSADTAAFVPSVTANIVASAPIHNACHSRIRTDCRAAVARALVLPDNKNATVLAYRAIGTCGIRSTEENASRNRSPGRKRRRIIRSDLRCFNKRRLATAVVPAHAGSHPVMDSRLRGNDGKPYSR
jgi:hypothetical protein